jgi:ParB/RepB/Spo0J family partition protein
LDAIFADAALPSSEQAQAILQDQIRWIPLERLLDNPYQPREEIAIDDDLQELAASIKVNGFQGVLTVRFSPDREGYYELAYGHRRREAARLAGVTHIPVIVRELTNRAMAGIAAVENIHRKDLTTLELGRLFLRMLEEGYTQEDIAGQVGKDRGYVVNRLRVARAPVDVQQLVLEKPDSLRAVSTLVKVEDGTIRTAMIEALKQGRVTTDDLPGYQAALEQEHHNVQRPPIAATPSSNGVQYEPGAQELTVASAVSSADHEAGDSALEERTAEILEAPSSSPYIEDFALLQERVGKAKLATVERNLKGYREGLRRRSPLAISRQEQASLAKIATLLQEITQLTQTQPTN